MTTTQRPTLTDVIDHTGRPQFADAGATAQGGRRRLKECSACHGQVVFVQNSAGKWYLADTFPYVGDRDSAYTTTARYYLKNAPHFKTCGTRQNDNAGCAVDAAKQQAIAVRNAFYDWLDAIEASGVVVTPEEQQRKRAEITAEYATRDTL